MTNATENKDQTSSTKTETPKKVNWSKVLKVTASVGAVVIAGVVAFAHYKKSCSTSPSTGGEGGNEPTSDTSSPQVSE